MAICSAEFYSLGKFGHFDIRVANAGQIRSRIERIHFRIRFRNTDCKCSDLSGALFIFGSSDS